MLGIEKGISKWRGQCVPLVSTCRSLFVQGNSSFCFALLLDSMSAGGGFGNVQLRPRIGCNWATPSVDCRWWIWHLKRQFKRFQYFFYNVVECGYDTSGRTTSLHLHIHIGLLNVSAQIVQAHGRATASKAGEASKSHAIQFRKAVMTWQSFWCKRHDHSKYTYCNSKNVAGHGLMSNLNKVTHAQ